MYQRTKQRMFVLSCSLNGSDESSLPVICFKYIIFCKITDNEGAINEDLEIRLLNLFMYFPGSINLKQ